MAASQQFSLRWNNYSHHIVTAFDDLRAGDELTDVTLSCDGQRIKAHKMLLSACSVYFRDTFRENPCKHPIIILKGVSFIDLKAVVTFMYNGQVNVTQERLPFFLQTAELLQIKGLTDMNDKEESTVNNRQHASTSNNNAANANSSNLSHLDSGSINETSEMISRPPSPKRKRPGMMSQNTIISDTSDNMGMVGFNSSTAASVISGGIGHGMAMGNGLAMAGPSITSVTGGGGTISNISGGLINPHPVVAPSESNSSDNFPGGAVVKYEEDEVPDDDEYDKNDMSEDNDNSVQDILGSMDTSALGERRRDDLAPFHLLTLMRKGNNPSSSEQAKISEGEKIFTSTFLEKQKEAGKKCRDVYTRETYNSFIAHLKNIKSQIEHGQVVSPYEKQMSNKYMIIKIPEISANDQETMKERLFKIIAKDSESNKKKFPNPLLCVTLEETYLILHVLHLGTGHKGRDRLIKEVNARGYVNITRHMIETYLISCCIDCPGRRRIFPSTKGCSTGLDSTSQCEGEEHKSEEILPYEPVPFQDQSDI